MKLRWVFRGLLIGLLAGLGWVIWSTWRWCDSEQLRQRVLELLASQFPDAELHVGNVRLVGLGGVVIEDIRLSAPEASGNHASLEIGRGAVYLNRLALARRQVVPTEVVLRQLRARLRRRADGRWDYPPVLARGFRGATAVLVRIEQASLELDDERLGERLRCDIDAGRLRQQAHDEWEGEMCGQLQGGGRFSVTGTWRPDPATSDTTGLPAGIIRASWQLHDLPIQPEWQARLVRLTGWNELANWRVSGWLTWRGELLYRSGQAIQWQSQELQLRDCTLAVPPLPEPIHSLRGRLILEADGLRLEQLHGQLLGANLELNGIWRGFRLDSDGEIRATLQTLQVGPALYDKFPPALTRVCQSFAAEGPVQLNLAWKRQAGKTHLDIRAVLLGLNLVFNEFPYPVRKVTGELHYTDSLDTMPQVRVNLVGQANGGPVKLRGEAYGTGLRPDTAWRCGLRLDLDADSVCLDETLLKALPAQTQLLAREFRPLGSVKVHAEIRRSSGTAEQPSPPTSTHIQAYIHQGKICYKRFPYPVEEVQGLLEIDLPSESWRASGFAARHKGGMLFLTAQGRPTPRGEQVSLTVQGQQVLLDAELRDALPEKMQRVWDELRPSGRADFLAQLNWVGEQPPDYDLTVTARGHCAVMPRFFPWQLEQLEGSVRYRQGQVTLGPLTAQHRASRISLGRDGLGGILKLPGDGSWQLDLYELRGELLYIDKDLLAALPEGLRAVLTTLQPDRPLRLVLNLHVEGPRAQVVQSVRWNGHASFARCSWQCGIPLREATGYVAFQGTWQPNQLKAAGRIQLQEVQLWGIPLKEVLADVQIRDGTVHLPGVRAKLFDGQIFGPIRYDFHPRRECWLDLTVAQVSLLPLAQHLVGKTSTARGKINARLLLSGEPGDWQTFSGRGTLRITEGQIYDLPPFVSLISILGGQLPRNAAFQEVQTRFVIHGPRLQFSQVELLGDALTLRGHGSMRVDGTELDLEMYALLWGRTLPLLPPGLDRIPPLISRQLVKIRMRGSLQQVVVTREPVPMVTNTLRLLWHLGPGRLEDPNEP